MADRSFERNRETYYRQAYRRDHRISPEVWSQAHRDRDQVMAAIRRQRSGLLQPFTPEDAESQHTYLLNRYGTSPPRGIGVRQGDYATLATGEINEETRFLATDYLIDCHALILVARNDRGEVLRSVISHTDSMTDAAIAVPQLLSHMPENSRVEATVIGSTISENPYLQASLMRELARNPQVTSIRYGFDAGSTVAVEADTGRIFIATAPRETVATANHITELPLAITFPPPPENELGFYARNMAYRSFQNQPPRPSLGLHNVYTPGQGFNRNDALTDFMVTRQRSDGTLNAHELREIASEIGSVLRQHVRLDYEPGEDGRTRIHIRTIEGGAIGDFISPALDPALGARGSISR